MKIFGFPLWVYVFFIVTLALGTDEFVISGILANIAQEFGVTNGVAGLLVTAFALAFCIGSPIIALVTDRFEKRRVLTLALLLFTMANAGVAIAQTFELAVVMRVLAGLAAAAVSPLCMVIASEAAPEGYSGRYLAVATSGLAIALFSAVPVGAFLADLYSWRATFALIAVLSIVITVLVFFLAPTVPANERIALSQRLAPFASYPVRCLVAAMFLCGAGDLMFYNYLGVIVLETFAATQKMVVLSLLLVGLTGCLAVFSTGVLIDRVGVRVARLSIVVGSSIALMFLGIHMATITSLDITFLVLLSAWSVFSWGFSTAMQASLIQVGGEQAMLAMALGISGLYGGSAAGAAIGGLLIDQVGTVTLPFVAAFLVAAAFFLIRFKEAPNARRMPLKP